MRQLLCPGNGAPVLLLRVDHVCRARNNPPSREESACRDDASSTSTLTSSSDVWENSSYHRPTAENETGTCRQITSSAVCASRRQLSLAPTGTATMIRAG